MRRIGKKSRILVTSVLAVAMTVTSVNVPGASQVSAAKKVSKVTIGVKPKQNSSCILVLKKGQKKNLKAAVNPKGASKKLIYKSSKKKIIKVNKKGVVKALKKKGSAKITVISKANKKKKATIKVQIGTPVSKITINKDAQIGISSANKHLIKDDAGNAVKSYYPFTVGKTTLESNTFNVERGRTLYVKASVAPKKATCKADKLVYKITNAKDENGKKIGASSLASIVVQSAKSTTDKYNEDGSTFKFTVDKGTAIVATKKEGSCKVTAYAADGSGKKASFNLKVGKFETDKTPAPTQAPDTRITTMIEDFESYDVGKTWDRYTAAGKKDSGKMTIVKDPEDETNKCLEIKYEGNDTAYDFSPIFDVDLTKADLKNSAGESTASKTFDSYSGVKLNCRVVGDQGEVSYKKVYCYFDEAGAMKADDKFAASGNKSNSAHVDSDGNAVEAGAANEDKSLRFGVDISMAEGTKTEYAVQLTNSKTGATAESKEQTWYFPQFYDAWKMEDTSTYYTTNSCTAGYKPSEEYKVGWATRSLSINKARVDEANANIRKLNKFDMVIGSTYKGNYVNADGTPNGSITLYLDNIQLIEEEVPITGLEISKPAIPETAPGDVAAGNSVNLQVKYTPDNTTQTEVIWKTDNDKATVDVAGQLSIAEDFDFEGADTKTVKVTATSKFDEKLTSSVDVVVYKVAQAETLDVELADWYDKDISEVGFEETTIPEDITNIPGMAGTKALKIAYNRNNQRIYFKIPEAIDMSAYKAIEVVGYMDGQMTIDTYSSNLKTAQEADSEWYKTASYVTYPFFRGSFPARPDKDITLEEAKAVMAEKYPWFTEDNYTSEVVNDVIPKGTPIGPHDVETAYLKLTDMKSKDDKVDASNVQYIGFGTNKTPEFREFDDPDDPLPEDEVAIYYLVSIKLIPKTDTEAATTETASIETAQ